MTSFSARIKVDDQLDQQKQELLVRELLDALVVVLRRHELRGELRVSSMITFWSGEVPYE